MNYSFKLHRTNINIVHRQNFAHFWFVQRWENWREWMRPHACRGDLQRWDSGLGSMASRQATTCHSGQLIVSWSCVVSWTAATNNTHRTCHHTEHHNRAPQPAAAYVHSWPDGPNYAKIFATHHIRSSLSSLSCIYLSIFVIYQIVTLNILLNNLKPISLTAANRRKTLNSLYMTCFHVISQIWILSSDISTVIASFVVFCTRIQGKQQYKSWLML